MRDPIHDAPPEDHVYADERAGFKAAPKAAQERIEVLEREKERERNALGELLTGEAGQSFVMRILQECGVGAATFSLSHAEASFADGKREIGRWLIARIQEIDAELYASLILAHVKRRKRTNSTESGIAAAR